MVTKEPALIKECYLAKNKQMKRIRDINTAAGKLAQLNNACCSCNGLGFSSQHQSRGSQLPVTQVPGDLTPPGFHRVHTHGGCTIYMHLSFLKHSNAILEYTVSVPWR